jgi:hypothetical protein
LGRAAAAEEAVFNKCDQAMKFNAAEQFASEMSEQCRPSSTNPLAAIGKIVKPSVGMSQPALCKVE